MESKEWELYTKSMKQERTFEEALDNTLNPFTVTEWHNTYCECGHSVSFHHFTRLCKGSITSGCQCKDIKYVTPT